MSSINATLGNITPDVHDGKEIYNVDFSVMVDKDTFNKLLKNSDCNTVELKIVERD